MKKRIKILLCLSVILIGLGILLTGASIFFFHVNPIQAIDSKMFNFTFF